MSNPTAPPPKDTAAPAPAPQPQAQSRWTSLMKLTNQASDAANRFANKSLTAVGNQVYKVGNAMKYSLMTKETEGSWLEVFDLLGEHFSDVASNKIDFLMGLSLLSTYYLTNHLRTDLFVNNIDFLEKGKYWMKFASGAYGHKLVIGLGAEMSTQKVKDLSKGLASTTEGDKINVRALCAHTGIAEEDILLTKWTSDSVFDPGHYIALDHKTKSIVIAFRGTFHVRDCLTDLNAKYETVNDLVHNDVGYVHAGIYKVAKNKEAKVLPYLKELKEKWPEYKVVITGHSLGAGTAALFAFQLYQEKLPWVIECFCYAPPCVMSPNLSYLYMDRIISFVYNDDIVPRLSLGSVTALKNAALQCSAQNESILKNLFLIVNAGNTFGTDASNQIRKYIKATNIDTSQISMHVDIEKLVPPGKCFYMYNKTFPAEQAPNSKVIPKRLVMEESKPEFFTEIVVSNDMFLNHMPLAYEDALEKCLHHGILTPKKEKDGSIEDVVEEVVNAVNTVSVVGNLISFDETSKAPEGNNNNSTVQQ